MEKQNVDVKASGTGLTIRSLLILPTIVELKKIHTEKHDREPLPVRTKITTVIRYDTASSVRDKLSAIILWKEAEGVRNLEPEEKAHAAFNKGRTEAHHRRRSSSDSASSRSVHCFYCDAEDHIAIKCPFREEVRAASKKIRLKSISRSRTSRRKEERPSTSKRPSKHSSNLRSSMKKSCMKCGDNLLSFVEYCT
ncbi:hypothetical protein EAF04_003311 [Stromatinia cepivora]|nr:hypothetical protein EAF04_003311 [Stromatinia cepivora]